MHIVPAFAGVVLQILIIKSPLSIVIKRYYYLVLVFVCVGLGFIGTVVPDIPTTPLIVVAAWLFARSSKKCLNHGCFTIQFMAH